MWMRLVAKQNYTFYLLLPKWNWKFVGKCEIWLAKHLNCYLETNKHHFYQKRQACGAKERVFLHKKMSFWEDVWKSLSHLTRISNKGKKNKYLPQKIKFRTYPQMALFRWPCWETKERATLLKSLNGAVLMQQDSTKCQQIAHSRFTAPILDFLWFHVVAKQSIPRHRQVWVSYIRFL